MSVKTVRVERAGVLLDGETAAEAGQSAGVAVAGRTGRSTVATVMADGVGRSIENDTAAAVDVLARENHGAEQVPGPANIACDGAGERLPAAFDRDEEVMSTARRRAVGPAPIAEPLEEIGFGNVRELEAEVAGWQEHGFAVASAG